jgi:hypothetical protein
MSSLFVAFRYAVHLMGVLFRSTLYRPRGWRSANHNWPLREPFLRSFQQPDPIQPGSMRLVSKSSNSSPGIEHVQRIDAICGRATLIASRCHHGRDNFAAHYFITNDKNALLRGSGEFVPPWPARASAEKVERGVEDTRSAQVTPEIRGTQCDTTRTQRTDRGDSGSCCRPRY